MIIFATVLQPASLIDASTVLTAMMDDPVLTEGTLYLDN